MKEKILKLFPFMNEMSNSDFSNFFEASNIRISEVGTVLASEGQKCTGAILLLSGILRLYKLSEDGKEMTIYRLRKGEICTLTLYCILGNSDYPLIAEVEEKATYLHLPPQVVKSMIFSNEVWQKHIFTVMSKRLADMLIIIEEIAFRNMNTRLIKFLNDISSSSTSNEINATHEKIASELGTDRVVISRLLKSFENKGAIKLTRGKIIIKNLELL